MTTDHIVKSFDEELSRLSDLLSRMGGLAESQLENSIEALQKRDSSLAEDAIDSGAAAAALERLRLSTSG